MAIGESLEGSLSEHDLQMSICKNNSNNSLLLLFLQIDISVRDLSVERHYIIHRW